jgi:hypothetical protein
MLARGQGYWEKYRELWFYCEQADAYASEDWSTV